MRPAQKPSTTSSTPRSKGLGDLVTGPLVSDVPGRTDALPIDVPSGAYVIPADIVSALGEGNTLAGQRMLKSQFSRLAKRKRGMPKPPKFARGGPVPIAAAGGEYVVSDEEAEAIGGGDIERGHAILDLFVKQVRQGNIERLATLPGPKR